MVALFHKVFCLSLIAFLAIDVVENAEMTFELPDNQRQCFYESAEVGQKIYVEFQVVTGGNFDVDIEVTNPLHQVIFREQRKQYDVFQDQAKEKGDYQVCFSNEFSTFTHKVVYVDFQIGKEKPLVDTKQSALTLLETASNVMHANLRLVTDYQTHHKLRETSGRTFAEHLCERVNLMSLMQFFGILVSGIGTTIMLKSFFKVQKNSSNYDQLRSGMVNNPLK
ncbi:hypothetical protein SNEBB_008340 [Seison nebaliae]|nr:hypothetical protein SNEBB_008340 [Seison nebaliae]